MERKRQELSCSELACSEFVEGVEICSNSIIIIKRFLNEEDRRRTARKGRKTPEELVIAICADVIKFFL